MTAFCSCFITRWATQRRQGSEQAREHLLNHARPWQWGWPPAAVLQYASHDMTAHERATMDNPHTTAALIASYVVLHTVVAELVGLLPAKEKARLRKYLEEQAENIEPIDEFEPECSEIQKAR